MNAQASDISLIGQDTGAKSFSIASGSDANPVVLSLAAPLPADAYTLTVTDGVTAVDSGLLLDGEVTNPTDPNSLPSGDGLAGGNAVIRFTVSLNYTPGDFDDDGDVDADDRIAFEDCFTGENGGPVTSSCLAGDFDLDDDVDCNDWLQFVAAWTATGSPDPFPPCREGIPAASFWGTVVLALFILMAGTLITRRRVGALATA